MPSQAEAGKGILQETLDTIMHGKSKRKGLLGAAGHMAHIPGFKKGGKVEKTGVYKLHKGEHVMTAKQSKSHPCLDR